MHFSSSLFLRPKVVFHPRSDLESLSCIFSPSVFICLVDAPHSPSTHLFPNFPHSRLSPAVLPRNIRRPSLPPALRALALDRPSGRLSGATKLKVGASDSRVRKNHGSAPSLFTCGAACRPAKTTRSTAELNGPDCTLWCLPGPTCRTSSPGVSFSLFPHLFLPPSLFCSPPLPSPQVLS